jgi:hypothetical protein
MGDGAMIARRRGNHWTFAVQHAILLVLSRLPSGEPWNGPGWAATAGLQQQDCGNPLVTGRFREASDGVIDIWPSARIFDLHLP